MAYATFTETSGTLDTLEQVNALVPAQPQGLMLRIAGVSERGLGIVTVWRSREDSDRFFTDHLGPALAEVIGDPVPPPIAAFHLDDVQVWGEAPASPSTG